MPEMTPVANQVVPPDPTKGINTFSGILGLKQRQLEIQTAQARLPGVQAESQQQIQTAGQRSALAQYMQNTDLSQHVGKDGTLDLNILSDPGLRQAAGDSFPQVAQQLLTVKNSQLEAKSRLAGLNDTLRNQFDRTVGSLREDDDVKADNNVGRAKVKDAMGQFAASGGPDAQRITEIYEPMLGNVPKGKLSSSLGHLQLQAQSATEQQGQQNPQIVSAQLGNVLAFGTAPKSTGVPTFNGPNLRMGLAPAEQPGNVAAIASARETGSASAMNDETLYNQITQNANRVGQMKGLSGEVQQLAKEVKTGKYSKEGAGLWTAVAQRVPGFGNAELTEATRRQLLGKYTQQLMLQAEQANGASTDAAQAHVQAAMPDPDHMSPDAIVDAARYVSGQADVANARAQLAGKHRAAQGNSQGLRDLDTRFMSQADPRAYVYQGLSAGEQRRQYLRDHPDFKNQLLLKLHQQ